VLCDFIGIASFQLDSTGAWSIIGSLPFDIGGSGQLAPAAPEPERGALLGVALLGAGLASRPRALDERG